MKRKAIKPFIRYFDLNHGEDIPQVITEILCELGYDLYESPIPMSDGVFISNVPLTEGWLYKNYQRYGLKLRGWYPDDKDNELDLRTW